MFILVSCYCVSDWIVTRYAFFRVQFSSILESGSKLSRTEEGTAKKLANLLFLVSCRSRLLFYSVQNVSYMDCREILFYCCYNRYF